jgi:ABC-type phosphate/phosphonate transport system substrate-binding protein
MTGCLFLVCLALAGSAAYGGDAGKTYKFIMPMSAGLSMGSSGQIVKDIGKALQASTGLKIDMQEKRYNRDANVPAMVIDWVKKGEADFILASPRDYLTIQKTNKDLIVPSFTIAFFGKPTTTECMYTRKSDGLKTVASVKGKRWGGTGTVQSRYMLYKNGFNKPMAEYFSSLSFIPDENITNVLSALLNRKIDVFIMQSLQVDMARKADKKYDSVEASNCMEYDHSWLFFYKKGTPPDVVAKVKNAFLNAHKDKNFAQFKFMFAAIQGHFLDYDPAKLKTSQEIFSLSEKYKWESEEKSFIKANLKK